MHFHALAVGLMAMDNCLEFRLPSYVEDGNPQHMTKVTFSKPRQKGRSFDSALSMSPVRKEFSNVMRN